VKRAAKVGRFCPPTQGRASRIPDGRHDDIVDALGLVGQLMDRYSPRARPKKPAPDFIDKAYVIRHPESDAIPSFMTL